MNRAGLFGGQWDDYINPGDLDGSGAGGGPAAYIPPPMPAPGSVTEAKPSSSVPDDLLDAGEALWTSPNTILGLAAGMAGLPFGARPTFEHGAVVFNDYPWHGPRAGALTLGNTILSNEPRLTPNPILTYTAPPLPPGSARPPTDYVDMGKHEEAMCIKKAHWARFFCQLTFCKAFSPMDRRRSRRRRTPTVKPAKDGGHGEPNRVHIAPCCNWLGHGRLWFARSPSSGIRRVHRLGKRRSCARCRPRPGSGACMRGCLYQAIGR